MRQRWTGHGGVTVMMFLTWVVGGADLRAADPRPQGLIGHRNGEVGDRQASSRPDLRLPRQGRDLLRQGDPGVPPSGGSVTPVDREPAETSGQPGRPLQPGFFRSLDDKAHTGVQTLARRSSSKGKGSTQRPVTKHDPMVTIVTPMRDTLVTRTALTIEGHTKDQEAFRVGAVFLNLTPWGSPDALAWNGWEWVRTTEDVWFQPDRVFRLNGLWSVFAETVPEKAQGFNGPYLLRAKAMDEAGRLEDPGTIITFFWHSDPRLRR